MKTESMSSAQSASLQSMLVCWSVESVLYIYQMVVAGRVLALLNSNYDLVSLLPAAPWRRRIDSPDDGGGGGDVLPVCRAVTREWLHHTGLRSALCCI